MIKDCRKKIESAQSLWNHSKVLTKCGTTKCLTNYKKFSILTGKEVCVEKVEGDAKLIPRMRMRSSEVIRWEPWRCLGALVVTTSLLAQVVSTNPQQSFNPLKIDQGLVPFPQGKPKFKKSLHFGEMNSSRFKSNIAEALPVKFRFSRKCLLKHLNDEILKPIYSIFEPPNSNGFFA